MRFTDIVVLALQALSERVILLAAMCMACGLFSWAMAIGSVLAVCTSAAFAVLVFLPILMRGSHNDSSQSDKRTSSDG